MVVNHIKKHGQTLFVCRIDKALETIRAAVWLVHGVYRNTVIAPPILTFKCGHWHQLHVRNTKINQVIQTCNRCIERTLRSEGANVHLIDNAASQRKWLEASVGPAKPGLIIESRWFVHTTRLPLGTRIGITRGLIVDQETIVCAGSCVFDIELPPTFGVWTIHPVSNALHADGKAFCKRSPNLKSMHNYSESFTRRATGNRWSKLFTRTPPPFTTSPVSRFLQRPAGSSTIVLPNPPPSVTFQRGAIAATESARRNAITCIDLAPSVGKGA